LKIGFFCEGFNVSAVAMPWRHVFEIASRMLDCGHSVYIFTDSDYGILPDGEENGISIRRVKRNGLFLDLEDLVKKVNQTDIDLINWHSGVLSALYFLNIQNFLKKKLVWTVHKGKIFKQDIINLKLSDIPTLYKFWDNFLCSITPQFIIKKGASIPQVREIITLSRRLEMYFQGIGISKEKIRFIASGVDTKVIHPLSTQDAFNRKTSLGFKREDRILLYFGPLSSPRGADLLISALPEVLRNFPSTKLILLSRKSKKDFTDSKLENLVRGQDAIRLVNGVLNQKMLIQYLDLADVVVLPFRFWPYNECPLTILEAMAMGKPVITTYAGSIPEIIRDGKTGILVSPTDAKWLSHAIMRLLSNEYLTNEIGRSARKSVEKFYDWNSITKSTLKIFEKVVTNN
jgi:glycosyltransferase involved in cell wall biosynthesis